MDGRATVDRPPSREPIPSASELVSVPVIWLVTPVTGIVAGNLLGTWHGEYQVWWMAGGAVVGVLLALLVPLLIGRYRARRIRSALRSTRRAGTVAYVEWHRRRGVERPYLMVADARDGPVRWCVPLLRRPHLPMGVDQVRVHGGLRPGRWSVPLYDDRPLWPVGPVRHRPRWTSTKVLGLLPDVTPILPRPRDPEGEALNELTWSPVRLSLKRTAGRVAVVAYELHTGRVLDSGFLPDGVGEGRAPEQNGLFARCPQRNTFLYGPGWDAVAVLLKQSGAMAIPVRQSGLAR
jgi:hypothetical protein